jgi:hypothetical protein
MKKKKNLESFSNNQLAGLSGKIMAGEDDEGTMVGLSGDLIEDGVLTTFTGEKTYVGRNGDVVDDSVSTPH